MKSQKNILQEFFRRDFNLARYDIKREIFHLRVIEYFYLIILTILIFGLAYYIVNNLNEFNNLNFYHSCQKLFFRFLTCLPIYLIIRLLIAQINKCKKEKRYAFNELTNKQLKFDSMIIAVEFGTDEELIELANNLSKEDRNFNSERSENYNNEFVNKNKLKII